MKILIIERDKEYLHELCRHLDIYRIKYEVESDPAVALENLKKENYKIIVTSVFMEKMFGLDILEQALQIRPHAKVILNTHMIAGSLKEEASKKGAYAIFEKAEMTKLMNTISVLQEQKN